MNNCIQANECFAIADAKIRLVLVIISDFASAIFFM